MERFAGGWAPPRRARPAAVYSCEGKRTVAAAVPASKRRLRLAIKTARRKVEDTARDPIAHSRHIQLQDRLRQFLIELLALDRPLALAFPADVTAGRACAAAAESRRCHLCR